MSLKRITEEKPKIVISSKSFDEDYKRLQEKYNVSRVYTPDHYHIVSDLDENVVGIIAGTEEITAEIMEYAPNLKVISRYGIGTDNIDMDYVNKHDIKVCTTTSHVNAVAEHTMMFILAHLKNILNINKTKNNLLEGKTIGMIGFGRVGQKLYDLLKPFNVNVIRYDINKSTYHHYVSLEEILKKSDIITLHLPETKETINMIDYEEFALMKDDVIFINTSRARIVNESALFYFAKNRYHKIALDVCLHPNLFEDMDNVIITHHEASFTEETRKQMAEEAIENLLGALK